MNKMNNNDNLNNNENMFKMFQDFLNNMNNMNNMNNINNMNNMNNMNYLTIDIPSFNMLKNLINENIQMQNKITLNNNLIDSIMNQSFSQNPNGIINLNIQEQEFNYRTINIKFICSSGLKVLLSVPITMKVKDLLLKFAHHLGINEKYIDKEIKFLYDASTISIKDERNIKQIGLRDNTTITVVDIQNITGDVSSLFIKV